MIGSGRLLYRGDGSVGSPTHSAAAPFTSPFRTNWATAMADSTVMTATGATSVATPSKTAPRQACWIALPAFQPRLL